MEGLLSTGSTPYSLSTFLSDFTFLSIFLITFTFLSTFLDELLFLVLF